MVKVCHMTSAHSPEDVRIFHKECVSLANAGFEVYLVERGDSYDKNGVHIVGIGEISSNRLKRMTQGAKTVYQKALELDCDIYHFHDPELLPYGLKLKKKGKKVIFDSHEVYKDQILGKDYLHGFENIVSKLYETYESFALKHFDAAISVCTLNGKDPFKSKCRNTCILRNYPILSEFYDLYNANAVKQYDVCYVGGLTPARGITNSILAAAKAGAKIALAGEFSSEEYRRQLEALAEYRCVDYRGKVGRKEVSEIISASRIGLAIIRNIGQYWTSESLGLKVYEYMAMGIPVLRQNSPFDITMMKKYRFGLCVDPEKVDEIADAIYYLLNNPEEAQHMGENGRRAIKEEFNWSMEEKKLFNLYERIMNE